MCQAGLKLLESLISKDVDFHSQANSVCKENGSGGENLYIEI